MGNRIRNFINNRKTKKYIKMETKRKIYIAGAITGLPLDEVQAKFKKKAEELKGMGFEVYNPFYEIAARGKEQAPYPEIMKICISEMMQCDVVCLLPDWQKSKGATIERNLARELEMEIIHG